ncbi:YeaC family protein [Porticoccaceae bacterium]|nr:YeaC family protein [Porticoccaceae bacterium]
MDLRQLLDSITPEIYEGLKRGIELGKWPDGRPLSDEQKELCMQAVIAYDERRPPEQRTGYVPPKSTGCEPPVSATADAEQPLKWKQ